MSERCPRCRNDDLHGAKFGFGDVTLYEFSCRRCSLSEYRRTTDPDFDEWLRRWQPDSDVDEDNDSSASRGAKPEAEIETSITDKEKALTEIVARPWDDAPRLAYADAVQSTRPERAELIRLQIERFVNERGRGIEVGRPSARERELLRKHGDDWARYIAHYARPHRPDAEYQGYELERGFIAQIRTDPDMMSDPGSRLFELAPIEHLDLTTDGNIRKALVSPFLANLRTLGLNKCELTDEDVIALANEGHLARIEWLDLTLNKFGRAGIEALMASPKIRRIPMVLLGSHPYNPGMQFEEEGGRVGESWMPEYGQMFEKKFGRIDFLHMPHYMHLPDRYHARNVRYVD